MTEEPIPPLAKTKIQFYDERHFKENGMTQEDVDRIMEMIYELRPEFFRELAEKERKKEWLDEVGDAFYQFLHDVIGKKIKINRPNIMAACILGEARIRARVMYNLPPSSKWVDAEGRPVRDAEGRSIFDRIHFPKNGPGARKLQEEIKKRQGGV